MQSNSSSIAGNIKIVVCPYLFVKKFTYVMPPETRRPPLPPTLVILIGILAVSTASIFIRYAQQEAHSLVIAAFRLVLASAFLAPIALLRHRDELRHLQRRDLQLAAASGVFLAFHFATWITSLEYTSVVSSVVIVQTAPLWVALLAPLVLKEAIGPRVLWGLAMALAGGIAVSLGDACTLAGFSLVCEADAGWLQGDVGVGNLLALAGALAAAGYLVIGRGLRGRMSLIPYIFLVYGMAALVLTAVMFAFGHSPIGYSGETYLWFILLAIVPQLLGHSSFNYALGYLPASFVSITLLGEPIGSAILAMLLLNEVPSVVKLTGAGLILLGIYLASVSTRPRIRPAPADQAHSGP